MTKSTIMDERITSVIKRLEHFASNLKWTDVRGAQDLLTAADGLRELQERRKVDSEPYGFTDGDRRGMIYEPKYADRLNEPLPVYRHAQPAPVVPEEMTAEQAYEIGDYHGDPVDVFLRGANWMRQHIIDSTLAAAAQSTGSEPAAVPGKWIPVSEQMPEIGDIVLTAMGGVVNVGEMECSAANYRFFTSVISGRELPATHWMPLPSAPKEGKP